MQQRKDASRRVVTNNLMWFAGSVILAFFVWVIATLDSNPILERTFNGIPIRVEADPAMVVTNQSKTTATVHVTAPQSTVEQLGADDIQIIADVRELGPGEHLVNLQVTVSRRARSDTNPRRITVDLESAMEKLIPVETVITDALPRGFEIQGGTPALESSQVLVRGPQSKVEQVTAAHILLNLSQRRNPFSDDLRLLPVDVDGNTVADVTVDPATMQVTVPIQARSDIRQVSVTPNILADTLAPGYALSSIEYSPQVLLISGPPDALESAPGTLFTEPIDLTDHTSNFDQVATIQIPNEKLIVVGQQTINVSVGISPLISSRQFDHVPVETIGLDSAYRAAISPAEVTVLMTGPQIMLDALKPEGVRAVIDLNGMTPGNYQLAPDAVINADRNRLTNLSMLPAEVDVTLTALGSGSPTPASS